MTDFAKDTNLLNGKGENDDVEWITVNGSHIPIKDGETPKQAIKNHFENKSKVNNQITKLGQISESSVIKNVLKDRLKSKDFGISPGYERHISKGHGSVFSDYKKYIPQIINDPQYIFEGKIPNRVVLIRRIDKQVEVILELSVNEQKSNQIVSMWTTTNKNIKKYEKKYQLLYKKQ